MTTTDLTETDPARPQAGLKEAGEKPGFLRRFGAVLAMASGFLAFYALGLDHYFSLAELAQHRTELMTWVAANQVLAGLAFFVAYILCVAFSLPFATLLTLVGGFLFGTITATVWIVLAATLGACAVFLAARTACGDFLRRKGGKGLQRFEAGFRDNALSYLLVLRLIPIFPFFLVNIGPALLGVGLRVFAITTFVGILPGTLVYAAIGNGIGMVFDQGGQPDLGVIFDPQILLPLSGLALLAVLPVAYKRWTSRRNF